MTVTYTSGQHISIGQIATDLKIPKEKLHIPIVRMEERGTIKLDGDDLEFLEDVSEEEITNNILTGKERSDFKRLNSALDKNYREFVKDLREIRQRKLFREEFSSFDAFMASKGHTRQWATQQISWLRRQELFEEKVEKQTGKAAYQLSVAEAQCLGVLEPDYEDEDCDHDLYAEQFVEAVIEAQKVADSKEKKRTVEMLKKAVNKRLRFIENREAISDDLTLDESAQIDRLGGKADNELKNLLESARKTAKKENRSDAECLKEKVDQLLAKEQKDAVQKEPNQKANDNLQQERKKQEEKPAQNDGKPERRKEPKQQSVAKADDIEDESDDSEEAEVFYEVQLLGDCASFLDAPGKHNAFVVTELLAQIADLVEDGSIKDGGFQLVQCDDSNAVEGDVNGATENGQGGESV